MGSKKEGERKKQTQPYIKVEQINNNGQRKVVKETTTKEEIM